MEKEFNICQNVNCHDKLLTDQERFSGRCQSHGGIFSDKQLENGEWKKGLC